MASTKTSSPSSDSIVAAPQSQDKRWQWRTLNIFLLLLCLGVFVLSFGHVVDYEDEITRSTLTIRGAITVPVLELRPKHGDGRLTAIVAHGFSGSKELMTSFGVELARAGVTTFLLDFPGHGASPVSLTAANTANAETQANSIALGEVVNYVHTHDSDTNPSPVILLGHSMGAAAVSDYVMTHTNDTEIVSTILISPTDQEQATRTRPRNLLLLAGQSDLPAAISTSRRLFQEACGTASRGLQPAECGNPLNGTGRRIAILPGLNHLTILNGNSTFQEMLNWLHRAYPREVALEQMQAGTRLFWLLCGVFSILCALFPLSSLMIEIFALFPQARTFRGIDILVFNICLLVGIAGAVAIQYVWQPFSFLNILLGSYITGYFFITALITGILVFLLRHILPIPPLRQIIWQSIIALIMAAFLYFTLGQLATFAWQRFALTLPRLWRCAAIFVFILPLFLLEEGVNRGYQEQDILRSLAASVCSKALLIAGLFVSLLIIPGLDFLGLVLPVLALLLLVLIAFSLQLYHNGKVSLTTAIFSALLIAWCMAATFPIT